MGEDVGLGDSVGVAVWVATGRVAVVSGCGETDRVSLLAGARVVLQSARVNRRKTMIKKAPKYLWVFMPGLFHRRTSTHFDLDGKLQT